MRVADGLDDRPIGWRVPLQNLEKAMLHPGDAEQHADGGYDPSCCAVHLISL
jgi:hypothetical protein